MPNETAPAHRHVAFAMRFIIEGNGGFTAVHGRRIKMQRGDVILTPTMTWHDQHYKEPRYPAEDVDTSQSPLVFPWSRMKATLDAVEGNWASRDYVKADGRQGIIIPWYLSHNRKTNRNSVSKTLGGLAERLNGNTSSPRVRETASSVYHIVEGTGHTQINDQTITWKKGDTFCVPAWYSYQHFADAGETVYLYRFDDTPMLKALGYYRKEGEEIVVED
jgi:gentisate 1,2-dioxygenase